MGDPQTILPYPPLIEIARTREACLSMQCEAAMSFTRRVPYRIIPSCRQANHPHTGKVLARPFSDEWERAGDTIDVSLVRRLTHDNYTCYYAVNREVMMPHSTHDNSIVYVNSYTVHELAWGRSPRIRHVWQGEEARVRTCV